MGREFPHHLCAKKKIKATIREFNGATFMLRCAQLGLTDEALMGMSMGMVFDMYTEKANDAEEYPIKATQDDIKRIFG